MIDDKDIKKLVKALKDIFPTAEMVQKSFLATDQSIAEGFQKVNEKLDAMKDHGEEIKSLKNRVRVTEDALGIE